LYLVPCSIGCRNFFYPVYTVTVLYLPILHHNLATAIANGLEQIFTQNRYADKVVPLLLQNNPKWGSRDRHTVAFTLYEMVRHWRLLCQTAGFETLYKPGKAQIWNILAVWITVNHQPLPPFPELPALLPDDIMYRFTQLRKDDVQVRESVPEWLHQLGLQQLGEKWNTEISALNHTAPLIVRANRLKTNVQNLLTYFQNEQIPATALPDLPDALLLQSNRQVVKTRAYLNGWFEVQDAASQMVAPFLDAQPNMTVIDACAGAGGKTLHLASLLNNQCTLLAYDPDTAKLAELKKRAQRNGANVQILLPNRHKTHWEKYWNQKADRLLLDVPCTGLGTLKRRPDIKWKLTPTMLNQLLQTQAQLLNRYTNLLKNGGIAVYATCSILPQENNRQIAQFIQQQQGRFSLLNEKHIWPSETGFDGFYMAKLQKN